MGKDPVAERNTARQDNVNRLICEEQNHRVLQYQKRLQR